MSIVYLHQINKFISSSRRNTHQFWNHSSIFSVGITTAKFGATENMILHSRLARYNLCDLLRWDEIDDCVRCQHSKGRCESWPKIQKSLLGKNFEKAVDHWPVLDGTIFSNLLILHITLDGIKWIWKYVCSEHGDQGGTEQQWESVKLKSFFPINTRNGQYYSDLGGEPKDSHLGSSPKIEDSLLTCNAKDAISTTFVVALFLDGQFGIPSHAHQS